MSIPIEPEEGVVLVLLPESEWGELPVVRKEHDSLTWGLVVAVNPGQPNKAYLLGRNAYWRKYKDDARFGKYALIDIKDIMGVSIGSDTISTD